MMEILRDISLLWTMIHTLVMFLFLFESRFSNKKTVSITLAGMIPLCIINLILFIVLGFDTYGTLMLATLSLPSLIFFWFMTKHKDGRFFFTFCMVDTTVLEIVYITNILNHYLTPDSYLVMFFVRLISYPLLELVIYKKLRPIYLEVQGHSKKGWGIFAVIGMLFYVAITLLMTFPDPITNRPAYLPVIIILFVLMPVIYLHIISTLRRQQLAFRQAEEENVMKIQTSNLLDRIDELSHANDKFREERHDFRHKLETIASLIETNQFEQLKALISEYEDAIDKTKVIKYCQHSVIDAVLSVYINKAKRCGIELKLGFDFPDTFNIKESDLSIAIANAIENAINASVKLPEEKRKIEIKVLSKPQFIIMVRNNFEGEVLFNDKGIPQTKNGDGHGFGTRSIAALCKKAKGYYEFKAQDGVFTVFMHLK